ARRRGVVVRLLVQRVHRELGDRAGARRVRARAQRLHLAERDRRGKAGAFRLPQRPGPAEAGLAAELRGGARLPGPAGAFAPPRARPGLRHEECARPRRAAFGAGAAGCADAAGGAAGPRCRGGDRPGPGSRRQGHCRNFRRRVALVTLTVAQFPKVVPPEIHISAVYVGADAQTIEKSVATPIEQQMSGVDNMNYMYSINANDGDIRLIVNFDIATDPNIDQVLTQLRVSQAQSQLPPDVNNYGVTVKKSTTAPLMLISLYSPKGSYDGVFLANYGYINLVDQLTRVPGIGIVQVFGAGQYAMRLWVKPDQLAKLGITVPDIITAVQKQNTVNPAGQIGGEPI